jgi:hypothetical protein
MHIRLPFAHFCRRVCEVSAIRLPAVPMRISVPFVPALNTVAVRSSEKAAGTPVPQSKNSTKSFLS